MTRLHGEDGGIIAKILGLMLIVVLIAAGAMYVYGKRQQPLSIDGVALRATETRNRGVVLAKDGRVYLATIVHNDGTLPITLQGLDDTTPPHGQPYVATSIGLGDGKTTNPAGSATFTAVALKPGAGVGIFVVYEPNPGLTCAGYDDIAGRPTAFPPIPLRFSSYGVESTQSVDVPDGPSVQGFTRAQCEAAVGG